ncbi:MAG: hypothetical protein K0R59_49 [Sphingobacterium sp.]|jgi:hypothetical protein|nr:hypothetical protein [Sphingobacterium sp.]
MNSTKRKIAVSLFLAVTFLLFIIGCSRKDVLNETAYDDLEAKTLASGLALEQGPYFSKGSTWKYLDDGSNQGISWRNTTFDDSLWKSGGGQFGFGEGDEATLLKKGYITYYFRKKVQINDVTLLPEKLTFYLMHDDGAVLYINGVEVKRTALMPAGTISYQTGTTTYIPNDQENTFFPYEVSKSYLKNGENTIAVEVHNQNTSSSDISFDCYVANGASIETDPDGPYVFIQNEIYNIKRFDRKRGLLDTTVNGRNNVSLTVQMPDNTHFSFKLQPLPLVKAQSEWPSLPAKSFVTSDLEGGVQAFTLLLRNAGVIDANYNWSYGSGHLYVLGDMFDRGTYVTQCLWLIYKLEQEAVAQGGKVHFILGNHDIMNMTGDFRYVAAKYSTNAGLMKKSLLSLYDNNTELGRWLRTKNIIEKAGNTLFVHAGISPEVTALKLSLPTMNSYAEQRIAGTCTSANCQIVTGGSATGLYWFRGMADEVLTQAQVDNIVSTFNADRVVIAHTINWTSIMPLYNNKVVAIDLDHVDNFAAGHMKALTTKGGCFYEFYTSKSGQTSTRLLFGSNCTN